jgi:hypothetical protein
LTLYRGQIGHQSGWKAIGGFCLLDQSSIPGLRALADALNDVLPEDNSRGDPQYLSRSALDICLSTEWTDDSQLAAGIACARRYWAGVASDEERAATREKIVEHADALRKQGPQFSPAWSKYSLVLTALDTLTPSNGFGADYLMDAALKVGVPLSVIRQALEANVPGLTERLAAESGSKPRD